MRMRLEFACGLMACGLLLVGCGDTTDSGGPPSSTQAVSLADTATPPTSVTAPTPTVKLDPHRYNESYDVQPRTVEVGGEIIISGECELLAAEPDYFLEPANEQAISRAYTEIPREDLERHGMSGTFEHRIVLDNFIGPGPLTVYPECIGLPLDVGPNGVSQSRFQPDYEPVVIDVTERDGQPAWASSQPLSADASPTHFDLDEPLVTTVSATCPADAPPGSGRVVLWGSGTPPRSEVLGIVDVPPTAYTTDGTNAFSIQVPLDQFVDRVYTTLTRVLHTGSRWWRCRARIDPHLHQRRSSFRWGVSLA